MKLRTAIILAVLAAFGLSTVFASTPHPKRLTLSAKQIAANIPPLTSDYTPTVAWSQSNADDPSKAPFAGHHLVAGYLRLGDVTLYPGNNDVLVGSSGEIFKGIKGAKWYLVPHGEEL